MRAIKYRLVVLLLCAVLVGCLTKQNDTPVSEQGTMEDFLRASVTTQALNVCTSPYFLLSPHFNYTQYKAQTINMGKFRTVFLWNTPGSDLANGKEELARPNVTGVELALNNTTCLHSNNCGSYETVYGYTPASLNAAIMADDAKLKAKLTSSAQAAAAWLLPLLRADQTCAINPFLEHQMTRQSYEKAVNWLIPYFNGRCEFVWNPIGPGAPGAPQAPAVIVESHGQTPNLTGRCIANPDGTSLGQSDLTNFLMAYGAKCESACAWLPDDNCRTAGGAFTDPRGRSCTHVSDFKIMHDAVIAAQKNYVPVPAWTSDDDKSIAGCNAIHSSSDGARGFTSKESDAAHWDAWTILLPAISNAKGQHVNYTNFSVQKAGKGLYTWGKNMSFLYTEDGSNRPVWRACSANGHCNSPENAPFNVVVRGTDAQGRVQCWKMLNPRIRND